MPKKYLVAVLYYGAIDREHDKCMRAIDKGKHENVLDVIEMVGCPYIDIGRSTLATYALSAPCDGILFIDHDMLFEPDAVTQVIEAAEATGGVVGAGYSMRRPGADLIGQLDMEAARNGAKGALYQKEDVWFFDGGDVWPAVFLGMGFTAIPKTALQTIGKDMPILKSCLADAPVKPFFSLLQENGFYYGEDVSFCFRAKRAGVGVFMDTRVRVHHQGSYTYGIEDTSIVVPFLKTLKTVVKDIRTPHDSQWSHHPEVIEALRNQEPPLPDETLTPFPESLDPFAPEHLHAFTPPSHAPSNGLSNPESLPI